MPTICYVLSVDRYRLIRSLLVRNDVDVNEQDILPQNSNWSPIAASKQRLYYCCTIAMCQTFIVQIMDGYIKKTFKTLP